MCDEKFLQEQIKIHLVEIHGVDDPANMYFGECSSPFPTYPNDTNKEKQSEADPEGE